MVLFEMVLFEMGMGDRLQFRAVYFSLLIAGESWDCNPVFRMFDAI